MRGESTKNRLNCRGKRAAQRVALWWKSFAFKVECTTFAPVVNANVKHNPNPTPTLNQKPNHYPHSNSIVGDIITGAIVEWANVGSPKDQHLLWGPLFSPVYETLRSSSCDTRKIRVTHANSKYKIAGFGYGACSNWSDTGNFLWPQTWTFPTCEKKKSWRERWWGL